MTILFTAEYFRLKTSSPIVEADDNWARNLIYQNLTRRGNFTSDYFDVSDMADLDGKITIGEFEDTVDMIQLKHLQPLYSDLFNELKPPTSNETFSNKLFLQYLLKDREYMHRVIDVVVNHLNKDNVDQYTNLLKIELIGSSEQRSEKQAIAMQEVIYVDLMKDYQDFYRTTVDKYYKLLPNEQRDDFVTHTIKLKSRLEKQVELLLTKSLKENVYVDESSATHEVVIRPDKAVKQRIEQATEVEIGKVFEKVKTLNTKLQGKDFPKELRQAMSELQQQVRQHDFRKTAVLEIKDFIGSLYTCKVAMEDIEGDTKAEILTKIKQYQNQQMKSFLKIMDDNRLTSANKKKDPRELTRSQRICTLTETYKDKAPFPISNIISPKKDTQLPTIVFKGNQLSLTEDIKVRSVLVNSYGVEVYTDKGNYTVRKNSTEYRTIPEMLNGVKTLPVNHSLLNFILQLLSHGNDLRKRV